MKNFECFLIDSGVTVLPTTNPWELVRFRCDKGIGIIYKDSRGGRTYCGPSEEAWTAFKAGKPWSGIIKNKRTKGVIVKEAIFKRDGTQCFYCRNGFTEDNAPTLEHLLSIASGGNNHIDNLVLAHRECNYRAADMALVDKIKLREGIQERHVDVKKILNNLKLMDDGNTPQGFSLRDACYALCNELERLCG